VSTFQQAESINRLQEKVKIKVKILFAGIVTSLCASLVYAGPLDLFLSQLDAVQKNRDVPFTHPDIDRDGVRNVYDMDDDGDGVIDSLDLAPTDPEVSDRIDVKPWINEIRYGRFGSGDSALFVEIAKWGSDTCEEIYVTGFNESGDLLLTNWSQMHPDRGMRLDRAHSRYKDDVKCEFSKANGYGFVDVIFEAEEGVDPSQVRGVLLERGTECLEVLSFDAEITPQTGQCAGYVPTVVSVLDLQPDTTLARAGVGSTRDDFAAWYVDTRAYTPSSGYLPMANNYQSLLWAPAETRFTPGTTHIGMLEIPKPRNSVVKALMDQGWTKPPRNKNALKVSKVSGVTEELLVDDFESSYVFYSHQLRSDFFDYIGFSLGLYIEKLGSVRAENYSHHFSFQDASEFLNEVAFQRGRLDARAIWNKDRGFVFFSAGSGGGYYGASDPAWYDDTVPLGYVDEATGDRVNAVMWPKRNFDVSYDRNSPDYEDNDPLTNGSQVDLNEQNKFGGGSIREMASFGYLHEYFHNWESHFHILYRPLGPKRFAFSGDRDGNGYVNADNPVMHGLSNQFEQLFVEYVLEEQVFDGAEDKFNTAFGDNLMFFQDGFPSPDYDYTQAMLEGNQAMEHHWANYLISNYGLHKSMIEWRRREGATGDWRIALHQTFGKDYRELFEEAGKWIKSLESPSQYRKTYESGEHLLDELNVSFNVSLLQARNSMSPNQHYRTLYTYVGEGSPTGLGSTWMPVMFDSSDSIIFEDGANVSVTESPSGGLLINGHAAYFYSDDTSIFHAGGLAAGSQWSAFTQYGERTSDLWFPVSIYDHDKDGLPDDYDPDYQAIYFNADGTYKLDVWPSATPAD
jgi:hypothetical protein